MRKVSISIPTYNQEGYICKAVETALMQSYTNLEVIVVDDASTDGTRELMSSFLTDPRFKYYKNETNLGRVMNYRKGLYEHSSGDYFINLDGDDYFVDTNFVKNAVEVLDHNPSVMFYQANCFTQYGGSDFETISENHREQPRIITGIRFVENFFYGQQFFYHLACVYRRGNAIVNECYKADSVWTDGISLFSLALTGDVAVSSKKVGVWRLHDSNESKKFYAKASFGDVFEVVDHVSSLKASVSSHSANYFRYINSYNFIISLLKAKSLSQLRKFVGYLLKNKPYILIRYGFWIFVRLVFNGFIYFKRFYFK